MQTEARATTVMPPTASMIINFMGMPEQNPATNNARIPDPINAAPG